jgi:hypothetical protein
MKFKKGYEVRLIQPVIEGPILSVAIVDDEVQYEVEYVGADGEIHRRFFKEADLESKPQDS